MQRTRCQILEVLKKNGGTTLDELARGLGLSPVTIRSHLAVLERDSLVFSEEVRGKVGRPHFVYSLAPKADEWFPKSYHIMANRLLDTLVEVDGEDKLQQLADRMAERWAHDWAHRVQGPDLESRVAQVANVRSQEGAIAEWEGLEGGYLLRQYHCPCIEVARRHPVVCQAEMGYIERLLQVNVQRREHRIDGDNVCAYFIPR